MKKLQDTTATIEEWLRLRQVVVRFTYYEAKLPQESFENLYEKHFIYMAVNEQIAEHMGDFCAARVAFEQTLMENGAEFAEKLKGWRKDFDEVFETKLARVKALPKEILSTIEDLRIFTLGYMTVKTWKLLKAYVKKKPPFKRWAASETQ